MSELPEGWSQCELHELGEVVADYLIRLKPDRSRVTPEFLNLTLSSHGVRLHIEVPARSTSGVNNINSDEVRALELALPPLAEQQEIVRRVVALFTTADAIEARYRTAKAHVGKLTQAMLARAFSGKLVATEAELARREERGYEHASLLLERIRHERAQLQQTTAKSKANAATRGKKGTATKGMFA